jgi:SAM-dependent methyltransferase
MLMNFTDDTYYHAFDHNYREAYRNGAAYMDEGSKTVEEWLARLRELLLKTGFPSTHTRLLDVGCGDGTISLFLSGLGYDYTGVDISEAAVDNARRRAREASRDVDVRVGNAMELYDFQDEEFSIVLDSYCFHMLVIDAHRAAYLESVRRVLSDTGNFVLLAQRDDPGAIDKPVNSFLEWQDTQPESAHPTVPYQKCIEGEWRTIEGTRIFLLGRSQSMDGYAKEITSAGFDIEYSVTWEDQRKAAFICKKSLAERGAE